jgi:hypothetical protein
MFDFGVVPKPQHAGLHSIDRKVPTKPYFEKPLQWCDAGDCPHFRTDAKSQPAVVQPGSAPSHQYDNLSH